MRTKASIVVAGIATIAFSHAVVVAYQAAKPKMRSVWDGVYTDAQATRAQPLYARTCANCHGDTLSGNDAPPLVGAEFSANWSDLTLEDLSERIRLTMPPEDSGGLSRGQVADLIAMILRRGEIPAGDAELPPGNNEELKGILIVGTRPDNLATRTPTKP